MRAIFDIDIVPHRSATASRTDPRHLLVFAIIVTVLAIAWAVRAARKARRLAARGVQTTGRIESIAPLTKHGASPMTISYTAAGARQQVRVDLPAEQYAVGESVTVLYDPDRPGECEVH
jgi:hypothetical protein